MGCTRREFLGWLPGASAGAPYDIVGDRVLIRTHGGQVCIELSEAPPRRLGLLSLPVLRVVMRFSNMDEAARSGFLHHFDLHTRRGGG
jgi:hypothetical protein